ncbi:hypothetical protein M885DRAFT_531338 [Pelagophyceae sp. CCMP2097]|nr:hypothetical protein M885DRAFT_531338 [Pelagophyceae sp. CCMP2097]|mmetsp:Transcript_23806/g.81361  ORF Transcript_23806/g.81361 Transcript_23806/m.81361 type:complete len:774 (-) Transcript_23806:40-2361(-)
MVADEKDAADEADAALRSTTLAPPPIKVSKVAPLDDDSDADLDSPREDAAARASAKYRRRPAVFKRHVFAPEIAAIFKPAPRRVSVRAPDIAAMVEAFALQIKSMAGPSSVIDADGARAQKWGAFMVSAYVYVSLVTPFEVGLIGTTTRHEALYWCNRIVDLVFLADVFVIFHTAYVHRALPGVQDDMDGKTVRDLGKIRKRYLTGACAFDVCVTVPWDELFVLMRGRSSDGALQYVRVMRLIRLLRLAKFKYTRTSYQQRLEAYYAIPLAYYSLLSLLVKVMLASHVFACAWALAGTLSCGGATSSEDDGAFSVCKHPSWLGGLQVILMRQRIQGITNSEKYWAALYWAMYTLTSVGYGDFSATNELELQVATVALLVGSFLWAYIIGSACSILTSVNFEEVEFEQLMLNLNNFLSRKNMPIELRVELRQFFNKRRLLHQPYSEEALVALMSPALKGRAVRLRSAWLYSVPYLSTAGVGLVTKIEGALRGQVYPPLEVIEWQDALTGLANGLVARSGVIHRRGSHWGADMILDNAMLKNREPIHTVTFCELLSISKGAFYAIMLDHPDHFDTVRRLRVKYLLISGMLQVVAYIRSGDVGEVQRITRGADAVRARSQRAAAARRMRRSRDDAPATGDGRAGENPGDGRASFSPKNALDAASFLHEPELEALFRADGAAARESHDDAGARSRASPAAPADALAAVLGKLVLDRLAVLEARPQAGYDRDNQVADFEDYADQGLRRRDPSFQDTALKIDRKLGKRQKSMLWSRPNE